MNIRIIIFFLNDFWFLLNNVWILRITLNWIFFDNLCLNSGLMKISNFSMRIVFSMNFLFIWIRLCLFIFQNNWSLINFVNDISLFFGKTNLSCLQKFFVVEFLNHICFVWNLTIQIDQLSCFISINLRSYFGKIFF